jgi:hypothetical protein
MLTLERCRKLLGGDCPLSDAELTAVRDTLYAIADVVLDFAITQENLHHLTSPDGVE